MVQSAIKYLNVQVTESRRKKAHQPEEVEPGVYWLHIISFATYIFKKLQTSQFFLKLRAKSAPSGAWASFKKGCVAYASR